MTFNPIPEIIDDIPNISGAERQVEEVTSQKNTVFLNKTPVRLDKLQSAFAVALHMHQPLILDGEDLRTAKMIGNLQWMTQNQHIHGNHDAPVFAWCYSRIADFIRELVDAGLHPRVMLDYSGCLLFGLRQMGRGDILENLKEITQNDRYWPHVEWLGTFWGHAVPASTPVPDLKLHMRAWQQHFASIFGWEALGRVRGFSPPEMSLPNDPDVSFQYVKALRECGYSWLLVQEHSVEELDGNGLKERYLPRKLVARSSTGEEASIIALIKTQGSDTKLIGQMQPFYEAKAMSPRDFKGKRVPPLCTQISDGENGGVMMNEFPGNYNQAWHQIGSEGVIGLNGTEYLELLENAGLTRDDFDPIQPIFQNAIWSRVGSRPTREAVTQAAEDAKRKDHRFHMDGGSWTSNLSWVRHYENVLDPMNKLSAQFHKKLNGQVFTNSGKAYRNALLHLLVSETSCYRYWGQGRWTDYAIEICRRGSDIINCDF
jgi:hypothetical protein